MQTTTTDTPPTPSNTLVVPPIVTPPPIVITSKSLDAADRRRDWALFALVGGGMAMTVFCAVGMWLLQGQPKYIFYLAMGAMLNILLIFTGIAGLLVKRTVNISKAGIVLEDQDGSKDK